MRITSLLLIVLPLLSFSQHVSKLGRFSIEYPRGCLPVTVTVTKLDGFGNAPRTYFYRNGLPDTPDTVFTYFTADTVQIVQLIGVDIPQKTDTIEFIISESPVPDAEVFICTGNSVSMAIHDSYYDFQRIYFTETDSLDFRSGDPDPTFNFPSSSATSVRVKGLFDDSYISSCGELTIPVDWPPSITAPSILDLDFSEGCYGYFELLFQLSETPYTLIRIEMQEGVTFQTIYEGSVSSTLQLSTIELELGIEEVCFRVSALDGCDFTVQDSYMSCFTPPSVDEQIPEFGYATYGADGQEIVVHLEEFKGFYEIETSANGETFVYSKTVGSTFVSPPSNSVWFRITPKDSCSQTGIPFIVSPPRLRLVSKNEETGEITLFIFEPIHNIPPIEGSLVFFSSDSLISRSVPIDATVSLQPEIGTIQNIRLAYHYVSGETILSNTLQTRLERFVFIPRAFSPNNDGLNDRLEVFGSHSSPSKLTIFNKWGEQVYESTEVEKGWDGIVNGHQAPQGTYQYKISFATHDGKLLTQVGTFVLIK